MSRHCLPHLIVTHVCPPVDAVRLALQENLTPETTRQLLDDCAAGNKPPMNKWGSLPMNGQMSCEGPIGNKHALLKGPLKGGKSDTRFRTDGALDTVQVHGCGDAVLPRRIVAPYHDFSLTFTHLPFFTPLFW